MRRRTVQATQRSILVLDIIGSLLLSRVWDVSAMGKRGLALKDLEHSAVETHQ